MSDDFTSVTSGMLNEWNPKIVDGQTAQAGHPQAHLDGWYLGILERNTGKDRTSNIHGILEKQTDGSLLERHFWGSHVLDDNMPKIPVGHYCRIIWLGLQEPQHTGGRQYHGWDIQKGNSVEPLQPEQMNGFSHAVTATPVAAAPAEAPVAPAIPVPAPATAPAPAATGQPAPTGAQAAPAATPAQPAVAAPAAPSDGSDGLPF